ncbi:hypothetical protein AVEN_261817-1 [Araneus ventricosus]|uniref:Uncharacterized protein n=1 Tax=Araneus ventricosus TaxID=182803 RepID=A0A4Y2M230_ARAVE|nr:hypothetical protein AVEN_261817-1 [Araneus ventricosus]
MATTNVGQEMPVEEMIDLLRTKGEVFVKLFTDAYAPQNLQEEERKLAQTLFRETFPNYHEKDFMIFYHTYINNKVSADMSLTEELEPSEICNRLTYDPMRRNFIKMPKVNNYGRGKREKFNLGEFLKRKRENGGYYQLNVGDREMAEDLLDELNEDKSRNDQKADVALNRMVEMAAVLNSNCNYKIIELHSERRIQ